MKLTSHQKKIIDAIITKKVYDIPSYLEQFGKMHLQQYDFDEIHTVFKQMENGRTYMFRKGTDSYYYTDVFDRNGNKCASYRVPNTTTYEFVDYPMATPVKAQLNRKINVECYQNGPTRFVFDFLKEAYPVADSFDDIIDFITLWSYLKREALILEVDKPVSKNDICIFFEKKDQKISPNSNPYWSRHYNILSDETEEEPLESECYLLPEKEAKHFIAQAWKLNEENLLTCSEFIGKKIIPSSELRVYQQKRFKTVEQVANSRNLFVAWFAVFISVITVMIGCIPQEPDYLSIISTQISSINDSIKSDTIDEEILQELQNISDSLAELSKQQLTKEDIAVFENLSLQLEEISTIISEVETE